MKYIQFGVIEEVSFSMYNTYIVLSKKLLLDRKQFYLNKFLASFNINIFIRSILAYKHAKHTENFYGEMRFILNVFFLSLSLRYLKQTIAKLKLRTKDVITRIYDKSNNLLQRFKPINHFVKYVGLSTNKVSKYITKNTILNNRYYLEIDKKLII